MIGSFQVFDQVLLLLIIESKAEPGVIALDRVQQGWEPPVMVKAAFVLRFHEESAFADVKPCQSHRLVSAIGRAVRLEAVDCLERYRARLAVAIDPAEGFSDPRPEDLPTVNREAHQFVTG